ncbi:putative ATP-dependent RNA helicase TDRD12 [Venturia canescens]|uniref:putative ATP-dependent RNA helicase TDRD12 n=1 Tax=Venturia canescens TaxID=32260 RepID=UPI001C9CB9BC|nr:putative ATP-dependent RNA helicase TDRD12 [Venturia canescens]
MDCQQDLQTKIPSTAVPIRVTNALNPSSIKIYYTQDFTERLDKINNQLRVHMKHSRRNKLSSTLEPQIGDVVIIENELESDTEIPVWWVRGLVEHVIPETRKYNIYLVDLGQTITVEREKLTIIPKTLISEEYLTFTVGIHALLPSLPEDNLTKNIIRLGEKWSDYTLDFINDCISSSSDIYFDYLAVDENGKKWGEVYFVIDEDVFCLSDTLICSGQAISVCRGFNEMFNDRREDAENAKTTINGGLVIDVGNILDRCKHCQTANEEMTCENLVKLEERNFTRPRKDKKLRYFGEDCEEMLIRSKNYCERLVYIENAQFPSRIHVALKKMDIIALRRIQSYMWPAVGKGLNVVAVGPSKCGKTIGYILPIVSSITVRKTMTKGPRPLILILCSSTSDVLNTSALCNDLLEAYTDIRCVAGWNGRPDKSIVAEIYNGCQILIATPTYLFRFINQDDGHRKLINFDHLAHLVIDGLDLILDKYYDPFRQLLGKYMKIGKKEHLSWTKEPVQIVAVARHWSSLVKSFTNECVIEPYVCIGSYIEAAIFGCVKPNLLIIQEKKKIEKVSELLNDDVTTVKTMIVCTSSGEAHALNGHLSKTKKTLVACEKMIFSEINGVREIWKASVYGMYPVLICTDEVLVGLNITNIDWLVHFSLNLPSKTQFYFRFSTLMDNLKKESNRCKVTIVIDETNDVQLYGVVSVAKDCGTKIPTKFYNNVLRIVASLDRAKKLYPICDSVKAFGFCPRKHSCPFRHCVIGDVDKPVTPIKIGDKVKFNVTYVHNATHFTARIMEYRNPDGNVVKYSAKEYTKISTMIHTYYANKRNRRCHRKTQVGDICAVEESLDNFLRVKVLNVVRKNVEGAAIAVELKCIDTGAILPAISVTRLMEIPNDLANHDTHIVEVFLTGLVPYDDEYEWNVRAIDDALNWFPTKNMPNSFVLGTVRLHIADTLWVDPLEIHTPIIGYADLINSSLKSHMLQQKHGVPAKDHLTKLYELCEIGNLKIDDMDKKSSRIEDVSENEDN